MPPALLQISSCLVGGMLLCSLGYVIDISPVSRQLKSVHHQIATTAMQIKQHQPPGGVAPLLPAKLQLLAQSSPAPAIADSPMPELFKAFEQLIVTTQITLHALETQPRQERAAFRCYPIKLTITGVYKNLLMFINKLFHLPYFVTIEDLSLHKSQDESGDVLNMQLVLLVYPPKYSTIKNQHNLTMEIGVRDLFKPAASKNNLYLWAATELRFLGMIKQAHKIIGIVSDPLGAVYQVQLGNKIGLHQSEVVAINKCGIKTTKPTDDISRGEPCG